MAVDGSIVGAVLWMAKYCHCADVTTGYYDDDGF